MSKWIEFLDSGISQSGKTKLWNVVTTDGFKESLGEIKWYGSWRKYAFFPSPAVFEEDCLRDIAAFCESKTKEHKSRGNQQEPPR